ncbi:MAG: glucodextranase DOMON-like domain-containing protein [Myxococcota bacterium]
MFGQLRSDLTTLLTGLGLGLGLSTAAFADNLSFQDPRGDDNGWGKAAYPTGKDYTAGAFDMVGLEIKEDGDDLSIEVEFAQPITDPWTSKDWGGNGFSLQFVQIYLDLDGKPRSGEKKAVPGAWLEFEPNSYWEKVILISPQPAAKVKGEIEAKAKWLDKKVIIPAHTEARQKKLIAKVPKKELGSPSAKWGVQALVLSNEGFADKEDVLSRRTNEMAGEHRFGGGCDGVGDPQVVDLLAGAAKGDASEVAAQQKMMSGWVCADTAAKATLAKISMVRR